MEKKEIKDDIKVQLLTWEAELITFMIKFQFFTFTVKILSNFTILQECYGVLVWSLSNFVAFYKKFFSFNQCYSKLVEKISDNHTSYIKQY